MPESKRQFLEGKMQTSVDPRLVQPGTMRYAENINISRTEGASIGALENLEGNQFVLGGITHNNSSYYTLGSVTDELNDRIYWFFKGPQTEGIYELDISPDTNRFVPGGDNENPNFGQPINVFSRILEFSTDKRIFNFSVDSLITGNNVIGGLLYWTDGLNPPRKINIDRFRGGGNYYLPNANGNYVTPTNADPAAGRPASVRTTPNVLDAQLLSDIDPSYDSNGVELVSFNVDTVTAIGEANLRPEFPGDLINVGKRPPLYPPSIREITAQDRVDQELIERGDYLYDNFVYFAYRYKYRDGETTALSPFSRAAFQPKGLTVEQATLPTRTALEVIANTIAGVDITFDTGNPEVTEVELVATSSRNLNYYSIATLNKADLEYPSSTPERPVTRSFPFTNNKVYRALPETEVTRIFDGVPLRAKAQEFSGNRLVYGNYVQNYELRTENENGPILVPDFDLSQAPEGDRFTSLQSTRSVKSDRNYEIGIVYLDREGRQTPVLVAEDNTHTVPFEDASKRNILQVEIKSPAPYWASSYRFFIKQTQGGYETLIPVSTYKTGDKAIVRISGNDINKVTYDTRFTVKRKVSGVETIKKIFNVEPQTKSTDSMSEESGDDIVRDRVTTIDPDFLISYDEAVSLNAQIALNISEAETAQAKADFWFVIVPQNPEDIEVVDNIDAAANNKGLILETIPVLDSVLDIYYEHGSTFLCSNGLHSNIMAGQNISGSVFQDDTNGEITSITVKLPDYFNCFSYAIGVEERKVLGEFNETGLLKGVKASTVNAAYQQDDKQSFLIHSGIFNDNRNLNRLNEFNTNQTIEKELDVSEGSIQLLHSRDTNLIVFQEDKIVNVPINKNLIQSAGGNAQLTTSSQFFGTERSYAGEFGISTNPESFCQYGTRIYFADKNRGVLCQLAQDGITEISNYGMQSWVRDNIAKAHLIVGQYDDYHKQALFTFKNIPDLATGSPNEQDIQISYDGRPDPRTECNREPDLMIFKTYYAFLVQQNVVALGDVVFSDQARTVLFDGNYRWYRVQTGAGTEATYNQLYQISPYGLITGIESDCATNQPPDTARQIFDISSESFDNPRDACANGTIDSIAFHDTANSVEVVVGDNVYDDKNDIVPSPRTGWYIISEGIEKFVINLDNGVVQNKIDCDIISLNRRPILGSEVVNIAAGLPAAQRNLELCGTSFANHVYWFEGIDRLPPLGTIIYENDHNSDITIGDWDDTEEYIMGKVVRYDGTTYRAIAQSTGSQPDTGTSDWAVITGNLYLQLSRGDFIQIAPATADTVDDMGDVVPGTASIYDVKVGEGIVVLNGICSEKLCFQSPADLFSPNVGGTPFDFDFLGVNDNDVQNSEITYLVEGERTYGPFTVNAVDQGTGELYLSDTLLDTNNSSIGTATPLTLEIGSENSFSLPNPTDPIFQNEVYEDVRVIITSLCYRGLTSLGVTPAYISLAPVTDTDVIDCQGTLTVSGTPNGQVTYYDPNVSPRQYFTDVALAVPVTTGAGRYAVSFIDPVTVPEAEGGGVKTQIDTISATGVVTVSETVYCAAPYSYDLGYTSQDNQLAKQAACDIPDNVTVYSDQPKTNFSSDDLNKATILRTVSPIGTLQNADDGFYTVGGANGVIRGLTSGSLGDNEAQPCSAGYTITLNGSTGISNSEVFYTGTATQSVGSIVRANIESFSFSVGVRNVGNFTLSDVTHRVTRIVTASRLEVAGLNAIEIVEDLIQPVTGYRFTYNGTNHVVTSSNVGSDTLGISPALSGDLASGTSISLLSDAISGTSYTFSGQPQGLDATRSVAFSGTSTMTTGYTASLSVGNGVTGGVPVISYSPSSSVFESSTSNTGSITATVSAPSGFNFSGTWSIGGQNRSGNSGSYTFSYSNSNPTSSVTVSGTLVEAPPSSCVNGNVNVSGITGGSATAIYSWSNGASGTATCGTPGDSITLTGSASAPSGLAFTSGPTADKTITTVFPTNGTTVGIGTITVTGALAAPPHPTATWVSSTSDNVCAVTSTETFNVNTTTLSTSTVLYASSTGNTLFSGTRYLRNDASATANFVWNGSSMSANTACSTATRTAVTLFTSSGTCGSSVSTGTFYPVPDGSSNIAGFTDIFSAATGTSKPGSTIFKTSSDVNSSYRQWNGSSFGSVATCVSATIDGTPSGTVPHTGSGSISVVGASAVLRMTANGSHTGTGSFSTTLTASNGTTLNVNDSYSGFGSVSETNQVTFPIGSYTYTIATTVSGVTPSVAITTQFI